MNAEQPLWVPSEEAVAASNMTGFIRYLSRHYGAHMADTLDLHAFSTRAPEVFWPALWNFCGIRG
ncbi:MAG TPA: hypothetical protein VH858_12330, partial [Hyphomicrobiales bacterium]